MWKRLLAACAPTEASPSDISAAGIRPLNTGQGVFRDKANTSTIAPDGVTVALLDLGTVYDDAMTEDGGTF